MYLEHFGLSEPPFRITPQSDFFFSGARRGATLEALLYAIRHDEGIIKITGEVGSGKTMLCRVLMERLPAEFVTVYLAHPALSREDMIYTLAEELAIAVPGESRPAHVMRLLQEHLVALYGAGKRVVVLIDEAHAMPAATLEEIRLLSNLETARHKLLKLVLFGQPELDQMLARPDLRQLKDRITQNFRLEPLPDSEMAAYLDFRMRAAGYRGPSVFTAAAIRRLGKASQGLTRRINILADKALLAAFAHGRHQVGPREVAAAIADADFAPLPAHAGVRRLGAGVWGWVSAAVMATLAVSLLWQQGLFSPGAAPSVVTPAPFPAPASPAARPDDAATPAPSPPPVASAPPAGAPVEVLEKNAPLLARLLAESRPWLETIAAERWLIQLYTADEVTEPRRIENFLQQARRAGLDPAELRAYRLQIGEKFRYGIVYGDFASRQEATEAISALPAELKRLRPYPRQAGKLKPAPGAQAANMP